MSEADFDPTEDSQVPASSTPVPKSMLIGLGAFIVLTGALLFFAIRHGGVSETERMLRELEAPAGPKPTGDPPPLAAAGRVLYERNCISCHGARLSGTADAPRLAARRYVPPRWEDQDLANVIYGGKGEMPAFRDRLSPGEIAALVAYIRWEQGQTFTGDWSRELPTSQVDPDRADSATNPSGSGYVPP